MEHLRVNLLNILKAQCIFIFCLLKNTCSIYTIKCIYSIISKIIHSGLVFLKVKRPIANLQAVYRERDLTENGKLLLNFGHSFTRRRSFGGQKTQNFQNQVPEWHLWKHNPYSCRAVHIISMPSANTVQHWLHFHC